MRKAVLITLGSLGLASFAFAPVGEAVKERDGLAAILRVEQGLRKIVGLPPVEPRVGGNANMTSTQVINEFDRIFEAFRPQFRVTPRPYTVNRAVLEESFSDPATRAKAEKLIRFGCLTPAGTLVMAKNSPLDTFQFGRSLGIFSDQILRLTHQPDPRWTPSLMDNRD